MHLHRLRPTTLAAVLLILLDQSHTSAPDLFFVAVQPLRSSSRSLDAALLRSLGARRIGRSGSEGEALPEALTKPPAGKEESDQNREEMREKLRIVKARPCPVRVQLQMASQACSCCMCLSFCPGSNVSRICPGRKQRIRPVANPAFRGC